MSLRAAVLRRIRPVSRPATLNRTMLSSYLLLKPCSRALSSPAGSDATVSTATSRTTLSEAALRRIAEADAALRHAYDSHAFSSKKLGGSVAAQAAGVAPVHAQPPEGSGQAPEGSGQAPLSDREAFVKRLIYRSKQRGWLEVDLLLGTWAVQHVPHMSDEELLAFERVLSLETADLHALLAGKAAMARGSARAAVPGDTEGQSASDVEAWKDKEADAAVLRVANVDASTDPVKARLLLRIQRWAEASPLGRASPAVRAASERCMRQWRCTPCGCTRADVRQREEEHEQLRACTRAHTCTHAHMHTCTHAHMRTVHCGAWTRC